MTGPQNTVPLTRSDVTAYVGEVRRHLADLPPDVIEELTGGLDADLGDLAAESDAPLEHRLGPASAYADELRAAAELPPRPPASGPRIGPLDRLRSDVDDLHRVLAAQSWWPATRDFLIAVRPAWWVARALLAVWLVACVMRGPGFHRSTWLVAAVAVVVSVELGRGRWPQKPVEVLTAIGNVVAVMVLVGFVSSQSLGGSDLGGEREYVGGPPTGVLQHDGSTVTNLFAYDSHGRPLSGVQLFDQDGNPVGVDPEQGDPFVRGPEGQEVGRLVPRTDVFGRQVPNAFPLAIQPLSAADCTDGCVDASPTPTGVPTLPAGPQSSVPALAPLQGEGATPAPTASATTSPDVGATER